MLDPPKAVSFKTAEFLSGTDLASETESNRPRRTGAMPFLLNSSLSVRCHSDPDILTSSILEWTFSRSAFRIHGIGDVAM
jgi:hypothetical protein